MVRRLLTYLAVFAAVILGVALLINFVMAVLVGGRQVDVPDVRGLAEKDAAETLRKSGLKYESLGEEFCTDYPDSAVMMQDPPAGRTVKQGRKVFITLSRGPELRDIPYCAGKSLRTARLFIERAGFTVGRIAMVTQPGSYADEVLATNPPPGLNAVGGTVVDLLVSQGPPRTRYILPDLKGKSYFAVRIQLERLGLLVKEAGSEDDLASLRSKVMMQQPPPGFIVARGDTISIAVTSHAGGRIEL